MGGVERRVGREQLVEHVERVKPFVNANVQIVPTMVACPSDRSAPGKANVTGPARLDVPTGKASEQFQKTFTNSFAQIVIVEDWLTSAWTKLVINAVGGLVIENRTSDPPAPANGQLWLRTDL